VGAVAALARENTEDICIMLGGWTIESRKFVSCRDIMEHIYNV
jgi:hypothetical protein